ncbi:DUF58 domain-containing protein [Alloscardovia venturai]|uniref:DUF58 domain-containing protein n=1 Tax=Alloscardovia venturai TaxID=1769421 RepID=A0ABW2Y6R6_9BIFI
MKTNTSDPIRRKIEALGPRLSLPLVSKAMGIIEGEHPSHRRGSGYEFLDLRPYIIGDEARSIDWKASARAGQPIVASQEHSSTSNVWMFIDSGIEMTGTTISGESQLDVSLNALRMFAMLSLKRGDNMNFIVGNEKTITRIPLTGGYLECDSLLDDIAQQNLTHRRDWNALLDYALHIRDRYCLLVLATSEEAWDKDALDKLSVLAQTHPIVVVSVAVLNPFDTNTDFSVITDGTSGRKLPAFMRNDTVSTEVHTTRQLAVDQLNHRLNVKGATLFHATSSESMFTTFIRRISIAQIHTRYGLYSK